MFSKKDCIFFLVAGFLITAGFILMAIDPAENGFGPFTLWVAPPLLLIGFLLPVFGIAGLKHVSFAGFGNNKVKHLIGLLTFLSALTVYLLTLEPTASLWDCSEFIASAYKLQVPHTPGTPLSLLIGRIFTMLSFGDVTRVAWTLNFMSGLFSALSVYLLYHIIYHLGHRIAANGNYFPLMLMLSSSAGSLCLAFSDTFWFSAVEAETYGAACFFLMLLVWLILTGKDLAEPLKSRRLVLIFYLAGLSYCIHPMCLLALPLLPFTWFSVGRKLTLTNTVLLILAGLVIVFAINRFIAIGIFEIAFGFDKFFVNVVHLPFYSGAVILFFMMVFLFRKALHRFHKARVYIWSLAFILLGFTPYMLLFIRSNHNPPIDETNPENLSLVKAYMNRESYPTAPLLYGPYFDARIQDVVPKKRIYYKDRNEYKVAGTLPEYQYDLRQTFLPRIYSNDPDHIETYRSWLGLRANEKPGFLENLKFMFTYQLGHMYFRYLMWNFAGRAGDVQNSDWLKLWERFSGLPFEKARNQYWMIPLVLGIAGAMIQYRRDRRGLVSVTILFLITGLILALYLNAPPNEPRERDYIYVGSFIAFCIWIGLGLLSVGEFVRRLPGGFMFCILIYIGLPVWMLHQNYDDHNRSGRTFQMDNARNTLKSCAPNSILFTGGDNDTFPLWYLQEVEGFRTDVRVMVLSYMNTDWYINQLRKAYYDSGAFNFTLTENDYRQYGPNDVLYVQESIKTGIDVRQFLQLLRQEHPGLRMLSGNGEPYHIIPSRTLNIAVPRPLTVSKTKAVTNPASEDEMTFHITENYVSKNLLAILDIIISNGWQRPIYFNFTSMNSLGVDISPYVIREGPLYRLRPEKHNGDQLAVNTSLAYENLIKNADYRNLANASVHLSYEDHYARMIVPIRQSFNDLALAFLNQGDHDMARKVLQEAIDKLYHEHLRPSYTNVEAAEILLVLNEYGLADSLSRAAFQYYHSQVENDRAENKSPERADLYLMRRSAELLAKTGNVDLYHEKR